MFILHIEDDDLMRRSVARMLAAEEMRVRSAIYGEEGIAYAREEAFDLIVLDLQLPDMSGLEVIAQLRREQIDTPIIVLSGNGFVAVKVKALGFGADDYMVKPFHKDELVARIQAVVRRSRSRVSHFITTGPIVVFLDDRVAFLGEEKLRLTKMEYEILELLSLRKGTILTHELLMNHLYQGHDVPGSKIIDVYICKLRKKLGPAGRCLETVWGSGYVLCEPH